MEEEQGLPSGLAEMEANGQAVAWGLLRLH